MTNKPGKIIDLSAFNTVAACDKAVEIELLLPGTRQASGMFVSVFGKDSSAFKQHQDMRNNADIRRAHAAARKGRVADPKTAEESYAEGTELLAACTAGFRNVKLGDRVFTVADAVELYSTYPAIRDQVDSAVVDLELFIKG